MPSFDVVIEPDFVEIRNAVEQTNKEIGTRFDFKGSEARLELTDKGKERSLTIFADSDFQLAQVRDILLAKLSKRGVDVRFFSLDGKPERVGGDKLKQHVPIHSGVGSESAKKMQTLVKQSKLKLQAAIQGDAVRVSGAKRDELQSAIALIKRELSDQPVGFTNFRD